MSRNAYSQMVRKTTRLLLQILYKPGLKNVIVDCFSWLLLPIFSGTQNEDVGIVAFTAVDAVMASELKLVFRVQYK